MTAAQNGDMAALEALFAEDVVSYSDGGGLVRAAGPVCGRKRLATFVAAYFHMVLEGVTLDCLETNGQAAVLILHDGIPFGLTVAGLRASHQ